LNGIRVLEVSTTRAARIAGQLLADLGADVVRAVDVLPDPAIPANPGEVWWDRGKRLVPLGSEEIRNAIGGADVLFVDHTPTGLTASHLRVEDIQARNPGLSHVLMPPYAASVR